MDSFPVFTCGCQQGKSLWQSQFRIHMPTIIGLLDCTHIGNTQPTLDDDKYVNWKEYAGNIIRGTCNATKQFTSTSAKSSFSVHDTRIWRSSIRGIDCFPV